MRNRGFQAIGKGVTLAVMTADNRAESTIYRAKPNPPARPNKGVKPKWNYTLKNHT